MKTKLVLLSSLLGICIIAISFLSCALYSTHQELLKTRMDLISMQQQLQTSQNDLKSSEANSEKIRASAIQAQTQVIAQDDKQLMETVAGIYYFDDDRRRQDQKLDLRSDGSGYLSRILSTQNGSYETKPLKYNWKLDDDSTHMLMENEDSRMAFRIEGDDLIDSSENRWIRTR